MSFRTMLIPHFIYDPAFLPVKDTIMITYYAFQIFPLSSIISILVPIWKLTRSLRNFLLTFSLNTIQVIYRYWPTKHTLRPYNFDLYYKPLFILYNDGLISNDWRISVVKILKPQLTPLISFSLHWKYLDVFVS